MTMLCDRLSVRNRLSLRKLRMLLPPPLSALPILLLLERLEQVQDCY
jgi:hypothetical protein